MKEEKFLFVINPIAGGNDKDEFVQHVKETFEEKGLGYKIYETSGEEDEANIKELLGSYKPDVAVSVGGDGTYHMVAELLINTPVKLAIIPFGSANGMAKELGIPDDPMEAIEILFSHQDKEIDAICINDDYFCMHLSDLGINAQIIEEFEKSESRGMLNYFKFLLEQLLDIEPKKFVIETSEGKRSVEAAMIAIANAKQYGSGAQINPKGNLQDGKFELCIIKPYPGIALIPITIAFFNGTIDESEYVEIVSCDQVTIYNSDNVLLQVDGELIGHPPVVKAACMPNALKMLIPISAE